MSKQVLRGNNYWDQMRKNADKALDEYLVTVQEVKATPELKARLALLVKDWASTDYATREKASAEMLKAGRAAAEILAEAKKSSDPEVASRAEAALDKLEGTDVVAGLANTGHIGRIAIYLKAKETAKQAEEAAARKTAAEKAGKADEAAKAAADAATARLRTEALGGLLKKITGGAGGFPVFGIKMGG
jgi:pyruvate/2-oxoglutarate dehydrogenase complex dihydrolipoamide acyltransferase (E2) component